ncbi:MAG: hypothetical protein GEU91_09810 [Rhizobiales bacterium]|nr:hypothetical protein [Hyphomicrobiales bacterium]
MNRTEVRTEHENYIKNILVPHYINQIESLGFPDKVATIHPIGKASATGPTDHNTVLSVERAKSVGACVKKHFDAEKSRGKIAKGITIAVDAKGEGDKEARTWFGPLVNTVRAGTLESQSNAFRAVVLSLSIRHIVDENDEKVFCRQLLSAKVEVTTVPANQLEQKIAELEKKMPPELKAALKEFLDGLKGLVKMIVEDLLKAAEFMGPEIFIIFKGVEFIVPSDIALMFEFKDSRGRMKKYIFSGSANKIDLNAIEVFCQLLSIVKWLTKLPEALEEMEKELEKAGKKLNLTHQQIDAVKKAIEKAQKIAGVAKKAFDLHTAPNSFFRKILGDAVTDMIVQAVNAGSTALLGEAQVATDFELVSFESKGVFDIFSFAGVARTETNERIGAPTTVALDFAARQNQSLLGFQAHVLLQRRFSLGFTLKSFEISNGNLIPA